MKGKNELGFYLGETNEIRKYFQEKYEKHFSPDGVLDTGIMFSSANTKHIVLLMKENKNYDSVSNKVNWSICDSPNNTYVIHKTSQNTSDSKIVSLLTSL